MRQPVAVVVVRDTPASAVAEVDVVFVVALFVPSTADAAASNLHVAASKLHAAAS